MSQSSGHGRAFAQGILNVSSIVQLPEIRFGWQEPFMCASIVQAQIESLCKAPENFSFECLQGTTTLLFQQAQSAMYNVPQLVQNVPPPN